MPTLPPKNIIICSDGTGNTAVKDRGTNVFKIFEAIDLAPHPTNPELPAQVALYDDGVGTESFLPLKLIGGAFGWGLKRNVLDLYTGLVRIYEPGDRIFLFGFSRGAFTVRTLAGMIAKCGVLDWRLLGTSDDMRNAVKRAYSTYREGYRTWLWRTVHGKSEQNVQTAATASMAAFKQREQAHDAKIHFLGVWDTVDSVGGPLPIANLINNVVHRFKFPDRKLSDSIEHAVQALSIDDARSAFTPVLWEQHPNVEQVWFSGVHANVGGGYPKQGMSLVTLDWMMQKARTRGLRILPAAYKGYGQLGNVDDKLYDSRAGLGVFYLWEPREMAQIVRHQKAEWPPRLHMSVLARIANGTGGYAPGTLSQNAQVVFTPSGNPEWDHIFGLRAAALNDALQNAYIKSGDGLESARHTVKIGQASAFIMYGAALLALVFAVLSRYVVGWFSNVNPLQWVFAALAVIVAAIGCSYYAGHTRAITFSRFWHCARLDLREALQRPGNDPLVRGTSNGAN